MANPDLTDRMKQVLDGIAQGKTNGEIAQQLEISIKTVEKHRGALYNAFGVNNAVSLVTTALRGGVIALDPAVGLGNELAPAVQKLKAAGK